MIGAFGTNIDAAKSHWLNNGYAEGRSITDFNPTNYLNNNSDLATAFGSNTEAAIRHYITNGYSEGEVIPQVLVLAPLLVLVLVLVLVLLVLLLHHQQLYQI